MRSVILKLQMFPSFQKLCFGGIVTNLFGEYVESERVIDRGSAVPFIQNVK